MPVPVTEVATGYTTPPKLAKRWGVSVNKIGQLIHAGELPAFNLAISATSQRPRWRIKEEDVAIFERSRAAIPQLPPTSRRKRLPSIPQYV